MSQHSKVGCSMEDGMMKIECISDPAEGGDVPYAPGLTPLGPDEFARHGAEAHLRVLRDGVVTARCSLWWTGAPQLPGENVGIVGHYGAADGEPAAGLLERACAELAARGCTIAVGPMDGNTWRRYRLVTDRGEEPPFFMEPDNPPDWPDHFLAAGFSEQARYFSALCTDLAYVDPRLDRVAPRLESAGIRIRAIDPARYEEELAVIHRLSLVSFRDNLLYSPITEPEFIAQYLPVLPLLRPELVLLAEQESRLVGFLFALPDLLQARRGQPVDTVIVKTAAVLPGREFAGLGNLLVARCHAIAAVLGFRRAIHALMHESNESRSVSAHYGRPFRGYTLYSRSLTPEAPGRMPANRVRTRPRGAGTRV